MTDSITRQQLPVPLSYPQADRTQVLAELIHDLIRVSSGSPKQLSTKSRSDPTVALLDAWATVADVIGFYQQRIATESYLTTATEPQSVLALATLLGYRPRPGLAATCWLAYTLSPDPTDSAVLVPKQQLVQSIPGAGELPQTFETTEDVVARTSWNTVPVRTTTPLQIPKDSSGQYQVTQTLQLAGAIAPVKRNDVILISLSGQPDQRLIVRVDSATSDVMSKTTTVTLQAPVTTDTSTQQAQNTTPDDLVNRIHHLADNLRVPPSAPLASATAIQRDPTTLFPGSPDRHRAIAQLPDVSTKLLTTMHPELAKALYPALGSSTIGQAPVDSVQALRISTAPFGVQIPPRARFDNQGNPLPAAEWPLGDTQSLKVMLSADSLLASQEVPDTFVQSIVQFDAVDYHDAVTLSGDTTTLTTADQRTIGTVMISTNPAKLEFTEPATGLDAVTIAIEAGQVIATASTIVMDGTPASATAAIDPTGAATSASTGPLSVSAGVPPRVTLRAEAWLVIEVVTALPVAVDPRIDRTILDLNDRRDDIVPGSYVMIESSDQPPTTIAQAVSLQPVAGNPPDPPYPFGDPVVAQVVNAAPVAINRYGMSMTVTRLTLDSNWISPQARLLSDLRQLIVHAQSVPLDLLPAPLDDVVEKDEIDVAGLYPGIETGHRLVLTGTRADLGNATVQASEPIMVSGVKQQMTPGDSPYTTLSLGTPLSYQYQRDSVTLYGNVVPAHHGATITETLTPSGDPANPMFALAQAPVLADPSGGPSGFVSSLTVVIDGRTWTWVPRLDDTTPARCYITGTDGQGRTTITLSQPLPHAASTAVATYRAGAGGAGNVRAGQLTQPLTRPLAVATVINPLPASGGSDPDGAETVRIRAPRGLKGLGRVVSVEDAADTALNWAGVGKTSATLVSDGHREIVQVTVAGVAPTPLDPGSGLISDLADALTAAGDVTVPITVVPAALSLIVLVVQIIRDPDISWDTIEQAVRSELMTVYGYDHRDINEPVIFSDIIAVIHRVDGVNSCAISGIGTISYDAEPADIAKFTPQPLDKLPRSSPSAPPPDRLSVTGVAYISDTVTDTLILQGTP